MAIQTDGSVWSLGQTPAEKIKESAVAVSDNPHASFILLEDGTLWGMGLNTWGEVGDGTFEDREEPVLILENVGMVDGSAARLEDGSLYRWGHHKLLYRNGVSDLNPERDATPYPVVRALDNVVYFVQDGLAMFAIQEDSSLWGWGHNGHGELGLGHTRDIPVGEPARIKDNIYNIWTEPGLWGNAHVLDNSGTLWGAGHAYRYRADRGLTFAPVMENVVDFAAPGIVLTSDGKMWSLIWGSWYDSDNPVFLMDEVVGVFAGGGHTAAIRADGSLWVWGGASEIGLQYEDILLGERDFPVNIAENVHSVYLTGLIAFLKNDGTLWKITRTESQDGIEPVLIMENVRLP